MAKGFDMSDTVSFVSSQLSEVLAVTAEAKEKMKTDSTVKRKADLKVLQAGETATENGNLESQKPKPKVRSPKATQTVIAPAANDPYVSATFKIRNSKKDRLHRLHLERQLAGETPFSKQALLDEALEHVLTRYEAPTKKS